ncbi:MAG: hypothetical protein LBC41_16870 [Clostridiales bacterium]|jgi:hypothetical protein|nr:hypothetical protein [Clostridiales bacterium]
MKKPIIAAVSAYAALYVLQFLIVPALTDLANSSNEGLVVITATTLAICGIVMYKFSDKFLAWLIGFAAYIALIVLYTPPGAYGIGMVGLSLDGLVPHYDPSARYLLIIVFGIIVFLEQTGTWLLVKLAKFLLKLKKLGT